MGNGHTRNYDPTCDFELYLTLQINQKRVCSLINTCGWLQDVAWQNVTLHLDILVLKIQQATD